MPFVPKELTLSDPHHPLFHRASVQTIGVTLKDVSSRTTEVTRISVPAGHTQLPSASAVAFVAISSLSSALTQVPPGNQTWTSGFSRHWASKTGTPLILLPPPPPSDSSTRPLLPSDGLLLLISPLPTSVLFLPMSHRPSYQTFLSPSHPPLVTLFCPPVQTALTSPSLPAFSVHMLKVLTLTLLPLNTKMPTTPATLQTSAMRSLLTILP